MNTPEFTIRQLTGREHYLVLKGRALPYRPLTLDSTAKVELTWLPGSQVATGNVIGPRLEPTTIHGMWKTKYIGETDTVSATLDGEQLITAEEVHDAVEAMREEIQLVEVTWGSQIRRGFITKFSPEWDNPNDVKYSITFDWTGKAPPRVAAETRTAEEPGDALARLLKLQEGVVREVALTTLVIDPTFNLARLMQLINDVSDLLDAGFDAVNGAISVASTPFNVAARMAGIARNVAERTEEARDTLTSATARAVNTIALFDPPFADKIATLVSTRAADRALRDVGLGALETRDSLLAQLNRRLLVTYTARAGEDLRDVSDNVYGSPDSWRRLLVFNNLSSSRLTAGQVVLVPLSDEAV